jgi:hypothetical protein
LTRYEELSKLLEPWRSKWFDQQTSIQMLPLKLADGLRAYLGAPEYYTNDDGELIPYVCDAKVRKDTQSPGYILSVGRQDLESPFFDDDGQFRFGLRVLLESSPNTFPKQDVWFSFTGLIKDETFVVTEANSKTAFSLPHEDERLYQHLFEALRKIMSETPIVQNQQRQASIGFGFSNKGKA